MRAIAKSACAAALAGTLLPCPSAHADLMLETIRGPQQCPPGFNVKTRAGSGGMIDFDITVDAEEVAHAGALYRGRVRPSAFLQIGSPEHPLASIAVQGNTEGRSTRYRFRLLPSAARISELQIAVSLYEKDGKPTIGGGVTLQVHLAGFEPSGKPAEAKP